MKWRRLKISNNLKKNQNYWKEKSERKKHMAAYLESIPDVDLINKDPATYVRNAKPSLLREIVSSAAHLYYNSEEGSPLTDYAYDILEARVLSIDKNNKRNREKNTIGAPVADDLSKVTLPFHMGSMNKAKLVRLTEGAGACESEGYSSWIKNDEYKVLVNWFEKYGSSDKGLVLSHKLDGISGLVQRTPSGGEEGGKIKMYTRGDGTYGRDISHLLEYMNLEGIDKLPEGVSVRGEFIMKKLVWDSKYAKTEKNARNFVSGKINSKTLDPSALADIDFVAYEYIDLKKRSAKLFKAEENKVWRQQRSVCICRQNW
jgi:NAD-dependent DNA ligase